MSNSPAQEDSMASLENADGCPFCGSDEHLSVGAHGSLTADMPARPYRVICSHIDHDAVCGPVAYGKSEAIAAWNRRALSLSSRSGEAEGDQPENTIDNPQSWAAWKREADSWRRVAERLENELRASIARKTTGEATDGPDEIEIDRLRLAAFQAPSNENKAAYYLAVSKWFQDRHYRRLTTPQEPVAAPEEAIAPDVAALTAGEPALPGGDDVARDFWLNYDHQAGKWCVENEPPKVTRPGAEVIHTREVR